MLKSPFHLFQELRVLANRRDIFVETQNAFRVVVGSVKSPYRHVFLVHCSGTYNDKGYILEV